MRRESKCATHKKNQLNTKEDSNRGNEEQKKSRRHRANKQ